MAKSEQQPETLLNWMGCLADPTRLRLLKLLEKSELGVLELCDILQMPQSTVSRHLKLLADQGWIENRRQGTNNLYRSNVEGMEEHAGRLWELAREQTAEWPTFEQDGLRLAAAIARRPGDAQSFFAGAAGDWDKLRGELYGGSFPTQAVTGLLPSHWTVADLGCGTGNLAGLLAPNVKKVIGVDQSPAMLKAAQKRLERFTNVELLEGDITKLPIADGTCDAVLVVLVLTYVERYQLALKEARRVLKTGGQLVVIDLLKHSRDDFKRLMGQAVSGFDAKAFGEAIKAAGFDGSRVDVQAIAPEPGVKGPALFIARGVAGAEDGTSE
jgi:SAM-dependent methyltransferase/DNA-binding transcriptional ArsR family regulator